MYIKLRRSYSIKANTHTQFTFTKATAKRLIIKTGKKQLKRLRLNENQTIYSGWMIHSTHTHTQSTI